MLKKIVSTIIITGCVLPLVIWVDACNMAGKESKAGNLRDLIPAYIKDSVYLSAANSFSAEKALLGRYFFYDRRISVNNTKACSSCHNPVFSFTDGYRRSIGALGDNVQHNAPALINLVFNKYLTYADSSLHFPEQQINNPFFHRKPVELGWSGNENLIMARLKKDALYSQQLPLLFPGKEDAFTVNNIQDCISSFVKTILSINSPYDRYVYKKDTNALSASQISGMQLFFSDKLHCSNCHGGINFSAPALGNSNASRDYYQNTGLYNMGSKGAYPENDQGLFEITRQPPDMGRFKIPTLRNLAFTAPYLHDGSAASLEEVIGIYENGGRIIFTGDNRGDGSKSFYKNNLLQGFSITATERKSLLAFLLSLSDSTFCNHYLYSNPFAQDETRE